MSPRLVRAFVIFSVTVVLVGCGGGHPFELGEVRGRVTLDGVPVPGATLEFSPKTDNGTISTAVTNANGEYELHFNRRELGAIIGSHSVTVNTWPSEVNPRPVRIPSKYTSGDELPAEVKPGKNELNFDLVSDGKGK
ncbi:carboxypeptidase regulatory-like domain-containing protein [Planctomicrobium sp. SH664]|uniref:carboxypeptidase regulatory-like domain-containing protein n=1 Tax=Planctomicrobium sp. SH664 TaxID=3448125 RepID=UPI003F5BDE1B